MVSGKYSALSGAIAHQQNLDNISANLANVNTTGFKKQNIAFESLLRGARQVDQAKGINYSRISTTKTDFSQGGLRETGNQLDCAIDGPGFFMVQRGDEQFYTRSGHFFLDSQGGLKTQNGEQVLGEGGQPITLSAPEGQMIDIAQNGLISMDGTSTGLRLQTYEVAESEKLRKVGDNLYSLEEGAEATELENPRIQAGFLETSNVNMMEEMVQMVNSQRKYEIHHKVMERYSDISEKQSELGTIG